MTRRREKRKGERAAGRRLGNYFERSFDDLYELIVGYSLFARCVVYIRNKELMVGFSYFFEFFGVKTQRVSLILLERDDFGDCVAN